MALTSRINFFAILAIFGHFRPSWPQVLRHGPRPRGHGPQPLTRPPKWPKKHSNFLGLGLWPGLNNPGTIRCQKAWKRLRTAREGDKTRTKAGEITLKKKTDYQLKILRRVEHCPRGRIKYLLLWRRKKNSLQEGTKMNKVCEQLFCSYYALFWVKEPAKAAPDKNFRLRNPAMGSPLPPPLRKLTGCHLTCWPSPGTETFFQKDPGGPDLPMP